MRLRTLRAPVQERWNELPPRLCEWCCAGQRVLRRHWNGHAGPLSDPLFHVFPSGHCEKGVLGSSTPVCRHLHEMWTLLLLYLLNGKKKERESFH